MKLSLVSLFLFFVLLLTISPPVNSSENEMAINPRIIKAPATVIVTDAVIKKICPQTGKPPLCRLILSQFEGKPLFPKPLANVTGMAQKHAKRTAKKIYGLYDGIKDDRSELKSRYHNCFKKYASAMNLINKANKFMRAGKASSVKMYSSLAVAQVYSCDQDLPKQPYEPPNLSEDNKEFRNIVSIIYVICSTVSPGK
ncbi:hypothetical protein Pfo_024774 [Paulownia fortunei]|nr:hypothetical protein Pfo_024774 [Paulownia fortunei]